MLIFQRKVGETIVFGEDLFVTADEIKSEGATFTICGPGALLQTIECHPISRRNNALQVFLEKGQIIQICQDVAVGIREISDTNVRLAIKAEINVSVHRKEIYDAIMRERGRMQ